jgi:hypothetical protein
MKEDYKKVALESLLPSKTPLLVSLLRRWCITIRITGILDFVHHMEF